MATVGLLVAIAAILISAASYKLARGADKRIEAEALARRRPRVTYHLTRRPTGDDPRAGQVVYEYEVRAGSAPITGLWLSIVDGDGEEISTGAGGELMTLVPDGPSQFAGVGVLFPDRAGQTLMVRWRDADGEYGPESTGITHAAVPPGA